MARAGSTAVAVIVSLTIMILVQPLLTHGHGVVEVMADDVVEREINAHKFIFVAGAPHSGTGIAFMTLCRHHENCRAFSELFKEDKYFISCVTEEKIKARITFF